MKCSVCSKKIEETFLKKILGTYIYKNNKKYPVCKDCQKKYSNKELLEMSETSRWKVSEHAQKSSIFDKTK